MRTHLGVYLRLRHEKPLLIEWFFAFGIYQECIYLCYMAKKSNTDRLYEAIKGKYKRLKSIKELGVQKYSDKWILERLSNTFFRSTRTIENIVFDRL